MYENVVDDDHHDDEEEEEGEDNVADNDVEDGDVEDDEVQEDDAEDEEVEDDDVEEGGDADENAEDEVEDDKMLRRTRRRVLRMIMPRKMKTRLMLRKMRNRLVMVEDDEVKEEDDEVENDDVEEEDDDLEDDDFEEEDRSQDRDPHFVQACAVEMHLNISQEPLCARIYRKKARDQDQPERKHTLCASLRNRNALGHFTRATLYGNVQEKGSRPGPAGTQTHTLCEPVQSTCT